jgi:hypothetical protein
VDLWVSSFAAPEVKTELTAQREPLDCPGTSVI